MTIHNVSDSARQEALDIDLKQTLVAPKRGLWLFNMGNIPVPITDVVSSNSLQSTNIDAPPTNRPLVVFLEGTLLRSGVLAEEFLALFSHAPLQAIGALW